MKFDYQKIDTKITKVILQEVYDAIPSLMQLLAPKGWKNSSFHQEMMDFRYSFYDDYLESLRAKQQAQKENPPVQRWLDIRDEEPMAIEEYLYIIFPPFHNDYLELFYILTVVLEEITIASTLYQEDDPTLYYFDLKEFENSVCQLAHRNGQISKSWAEVMIFAYPVPLLDEIEIHYCLVVLFSILKKHGFRLHYRNYELITIAALQIQYDELMYSGLEGNEKEKQRKTIKANICEILQYYDTEPIDPFDLPAIIDLYNRYEICPFVLAYLHVYDEFPKGYPYQLDDYREW